MKEVDIDIKVSRDALQILGWSAKRDELISVFGEGVWLEAKVREPKKFKTHDQLGYLWGCVAPRLFRALRDMGWNIHNKEAAVEFIKPELNFVEEIINEKTGEVKARQNKSIAASSMKEVSEFISDLVIFLTMECGVYVPAPEEWKKWKKQ
jgi:hypothetical protein